jgi:hypothetical protein
MLDRLGFNRHVTDADLTAVWADARLGESSKTAAAAHVRECAACRTRFTSLSNWLESLRTDARQQADDAFPRERLAAQQAQILRRLEAMERPAKVLAFPRFTRPIAIHHGGRQQWIAAAAAAGLVVGVGLGQIFDIRGLRTPDGFATRPEQISRIVTTPDRGGIQAISSVTSDEDFLYDYGVASARVPESLQSLHEITPSAREYDPR